MNDRRFEQQVAALQAGLAAMLPAIPAHDLPRFARSACITGPYAPGADAQPRDGVPRGTLERRTCPAGAVYRDVPHDYTLYVPAAHDPARPAHLLVVLDGDRYLGPEAAAATVLDNLIHAGDLPPVVAVFVQPGATGPGLPVYGGSDNRSLEYDSLGDAHARFLLEELLPHATAGLSTSAAPEARAICGLSSGACCAFNAAWERPDAFGGVISHCGSFVALRGGDTLAAKVRAADRKPLRVFLQTGVHDLDIVFGDWVAANRTLASALAYRGYDHRLVIGDGGHSLAHGGALFPDTLRWLWRDAATPIR